ncbi:MAG: hypothetical protein ACM31C_32540 [Acidobacteriota bacterium]
MGFGIDRRARARKRLLRRAPDAKEVADRLGRLARRMLKDAFDEAKRVDGRYTVELDFHPAEPSATLAVTADGELALHAHTSFVGPGYHADVIAQLAPLLEELEFVWAEPFELAATQRAMCEWVAATLRDVSGQVDLGVERPFVIDAPVLTPLGPRDDAWRTAVLADPMHARDIFAWWDPGAPGEERRARALLAMWHEVPWREPLDAEERSLMKRVDRDLRAAHRAAPELELPWPEWAELLDHLASEAEHVAEVRERAAGRAPSIGYRRYDLEVELSGGWSFRMPGSFVGAWEDSGERYWATDGDRSLEFTSLTAKEDLDSQKLLAVAPERHPVVDRFSDGARCGRAEAYEDDDVHVVHGLVAQAPHVAILTCKGDPGDEPWALATWRSLRNG